MLYIVHFSNPTIKNGGWQPLTEIKYSQASCLDYIIININDLSCHMVTVVNIMEMKEIIMYPLDSVHRLKLISSIP